MVNPIRYHSPAYPFMAPEQHSSAQLPKERGANQPAAIPEGKQAYKNLLSDKKLKSLGLKECQTCKRRTYQDVSNDPGVSLKAPTHVSPEASGVAVVAHENEHGQREQAKANVEGKKVVYQTVQVFTGVCPECGRIYVSGGKTTTVTADQPPSKTGTGKMIDTYM